MRIVRIVKDCEDYEDCEDVDNIDDDDEDCFHLLTSTLGSQVAGVESFLFAVVGST